MIFDKNAKVGNYFIIELAESTSTPYREVYKASDLNDGKPVVLIAYTRDLMCDEQMYTLPRWETMLHSCLHSNAFVPKLYNGTAVGRNNMNVEYIVLEDWNLTSLLQVTREHDNYLPTEDVWQIFADIALGLKEIDGLQKGACHFNISFDTIYVRKDEQGKLSGVLGGLQYVSKDYPKHKLLDKSQLMPSFRAPETVLGTFTPLSMQFSLAVLLTTMLQGEHPWCALFGTKFGLYGRMRRNKPLVILPNGIRMCLLKAMSIDPSKRYSSVDDFVKAVMQFSTSPLPVVPEQGSCNDISVDEPSANSQVSTDDSHEIAIVETAKEPKVTTKIEIRKGKGFEAVAGMEGLKKDLMRDFVDVVNNRSMADTYGIKIPNMLFFGAPGTGKTYIAERLSEELGIEFSLVTPSDLGSIYIHGSQSLIKQLFAKARKQAKKNKKGVLLVFDEMDAICPQRSADNKNNQAGEVAEFLTQLNNCTKDNVYCIGTTNCIDRIDKAVLRTGRIDKVIYFRLPDMEARIALFKYELSERPVAKDIDLEQLAELTNGYTSSDIAYIVNESARRVFGEAIHQEQRNIIEITQHHLEEVIRHSKPSVSKSEAGRYDRMHDEYTRRDGDLRRKIGFSVQ